MTDEFAISMLVVFIKTTHPPPPPPRHVCMNNLHKYGTIE